jgi:hypothetical protein
VAAVAVIDHVLRFTVTPGIGIAAHVTAVATENVTVALGTVDTSGSADAALPHVTTGIASVTVGTIVRKETVRLDVMCKCPDVFPLP